MASMQMICEQRATCTKVQQGITEIVAQLDTMLTRTGGRKFRFDEE